MCSISSSAGSDFGDFQTFLKIKLTLIGSLIILKITAEVYGSLCVFSFSLGSKESKICVAKRIFIFS
jgi:hypothetical protein